jgi:hypothetical protein
MSVLSELTADQGVEKALSILLENGWKSQSYSSWQEYVKEAYDEDPEDYEGYWLADRSSVWDSLEGYTDIEAHEAGGLTAKWVATQDDGLAHDTETYFVILSLSDGETTRYFKRDGWYASYDGGHLEEGENLEVFPTQVTVTEFKDKK